MPGDDDWVAAADCAARTVGCGSTAIQIMAVMAITGTVVKRVSGRPNRWRMRLPLLNETTVILAFFVPKQCDNISRI